MAVASSIKCLSLLMALVLFMRLDSVGCISEKSTWNFICPEDKCTTIDLKLRRKDIITDFIVRPKVYCIKPVKPVSQTGLYQSWLRYHVTIGTDSSKRMSLVIGNSTEDTKKLTKEVYSPFWSSNERITQTSYFGSSPYNTLCIGIKNIISKNGKDDIDTFSLIFERQLHFIYPVLLIAGITIFYIAPHLTKNMTFYYSSGIALGIVASLLILLYVFSKFVPKKNLLGLGVLLGGYSFTGYVVHWIYSQGFDFIKQNLTYVICYVLVAGLVSFAVMYRVGPAHERTMKLVQWFLQLVALVLVYASTQFTPFSIAAVLCVLIWQRWMSHWLYSIWSFFLKPFRRVFRSSVKKKLLTQEKYEEQGRVETDIALKELRIHCRQSSTFWDKTLNELSDQRQMLDFLSGKDHVSEQQRNLHESIYQSDYSDESDFDDTFSSVTSSPHLSYSNSPSSLHYSSSPLPSCPPSPPRSHDHWYHNPDN